MVEFDSPIFITAYEKLQDAINSASNLLKSGIDVQSDNVFILTTDGWQPSGGRYYKDFTHNLGTKNLNISCYEKIDGGYDSLSTVECVILSESKVRVFRPDIVETKVVISAQLINVSSDPINSVTVNRRVDYPLKRITQDGKLTSSLIYYVQDAILDIKVINAKPGKLYKIDWMGNGYSKFGENGKYGFRIWDYDEVDYATNSSKSKRRIVDYMDKSYPKPNGVTTVLVESTVEDVKFVITVDYSKITGLFIGSTLFGTSVIDPNCYIYTKPNMDEILNTVLDNSTNILNKANGATKTDLAKLDSVIVNKSSVYPLKIVQQDGATSEDLMDWPKNVLLDAKVINAKPGKLYKIEWMGNGYTGFGEAGKYGFIITEFDENTYSTNSKASRKVLINYIDKSYSKPTGIVTRHLKSTRDLTIEFLLTIDYSAFETEFIGTTIFGTSIIDPNCYIHTKESFSLSDCFNDDYPLYKVIDSGKDLHIDIKKAIKDIKIFNARPNKVYKLSYLANGTTSWGDPLYSLYLDEYEEDLKTYTNIFHRGNCKFPPPENDIETRIQYHEETGIGISITLDYSELSYDKYRMNDANCAGYGHIIHPSCYYLKGKNTQSEKPDVPVISNDNNVYDLYVNFENTKSISVKIPYNNTQNAVVNFGPLGINQITHFKNLYLTNSSKMDSSFNDLELKYEIKSDWLSPYGCKETLNPPYAHAFTVGGNHGTSNGGGYPTASSAYTKVYVDGNQIESGTIAGAKDSVNILTVNYVSASNVINIDTGERKSDTLLETVLYKIYKDTIYVTVEIKALRPCVITRYCGFQYTAPPLSMQDRLYYMLDKSMREFKITDYTNKAIYSYPKKDGKLDRFNYFGDEHMVVVYKNTEVGIGDGRYIGDNDCPIYKSTGTKVYMHNIRQADANIPMDVNDVMYWSGGYTITGTGLKCSGCKRAYTIRECDKRVYCVDFDKKYTPSWLETYPEDKGKKIKIIDKSDTVTCEPYITSSGLRVSSTGSGQLKFTVE